MDSGNLISSDREITFFSFFIVMKNNLSLVPLTRRYTYFTRHENKHYIYEYLKNIGNRPATDRHLHHLGSHAAYKSGI